ncbi:hypothetical protein ACJMK2_041848 [Sinanodonta woodiana]|uniref:G protein gamma domain-containing protein n=1 Tax=Sinanodonta woodiana TaxID=1069815 RepID=A0ABD3W6H3_SINWO
MNKFQEGLQQQRKLVEQLRNEAAIPRVRHADEDVLIKGFARPGDNPFKEKGGCAIL